MIGLVVLVGYAAIPGLVLAIAGERGRAILIDAFVGAAVVFCAIQFLALAIDRWIEPLPPDFFGYVFAASGQLEGYAQNPNAFAFQLLMALAVLLGGRPQASAPGRARWRLIGAAVLVAALVLTRSRAGILCAIGGLALAAALHVIPPRVLLTRRAIVAGLIGGVALVGLGIAFWGSIDRLMVAPLGAEWRPFTAESDALRWQSMVLGWQAWLQHPLLGGGLGAFLLARESSGLPALVIHSVPIWFMAEMGLVGLAAYAFFVASLFVVGVSELRRDAPYARSLLVAVAVFVVMSLVHDLFFQRTFWFLAGLLSAEVGAPALSAEPVREPASSSGMP